MSIRGNVAVMRAVSEFANNYKDSNIESVAIFNLKGAKIISASGDSKTVELEFPRYLNSTLPQTVMVHNHPATKPLTFSLKDIEVASGGNFAASILVTSNLIYGAEPPWPDLSEFFIDNMFRDYDPRNNHDADCRHAEVGRLAEYYGFSYWAITYKELYAQV
jgi:hypothetical protein